MRWLAVLLVLSFTLPVANAQPRKTPAERIAQIKKRIRTLRAATLIDELKLDEGTAQKLFPILTKYDDETDKLAGERGAIQGKLTNLNGKSPKEIDRIIDDALANQRSFRDLDDRRLGEIRKVLTPIQTAKLIVVLPTFEKRIQNQIQKMIQNRQPRPPDGDDDDVEPDEQPRKPGAHPNHP